MGIRVGIDLGTTFSAVARINPLSGKPEVIKNSFGKPITPSVLCFEENGSILYGEDAKNMQAMGNTNTVSFFKRSISCWSCAVFMCIDLSVITALIIAFSGKICKKKPCVAIGLDDQMKNNRY